ncbi:MAG: phosphatase PAP2 family protein [Desulfobulbaceae bacterium]|nr:phosphatase PAP2 family protein [Desulfobulbaceae bacterium]
MRNFITRSLSVSLLLAALGLYATPSKALEADLFATDLLTAIVPLTGLAVAHFTDDSEGEKQWWRNTLENQVVTSALRVGFNETSWGERPNGSGYSFPSGHVATIVSGAAFLDRRYGWKWGLPGYLASAYVAYVRVDDEKHRWRDAIAGAAVGYGIAWLTVTSENATTLAPLIGPDFLGLRWQRSF